MRRAKNKFVMGGFNAGVGTKPPTNYGRKEPPTNYGKQESPMLSTEQFQYRNVRKGYDDAWYEANPRDTSGDQPGVQYDRDGRIIGGLENFQSEAHFKHDLGKNIHTDRFGDTYHPLGQVYSSNQAGWDAAEKQRIESGHPESGMPEYLTSWKAQQDNPGATTSTGGTGGGGDMINQNMQDVDVSGSGASSEPRPPSARDLKRANYNEAKDILGGKPGWRQSRRLLGGGAKSDRQLRRIKRQQRRKDQRAKNRRERGWGGFGWNWRKNR